jgi:alpha-ribazole phosphatase
VASALRAKLPSGLPVISSPLKRCAELATQLVSSSDDVRFDSRLVEMHFGEWELCPWNEIPRVEIDAWAADMAGYRPGGGESAMQVAERVHAFYDEWLLQPRESVVVCHAGTIRLLLACRRNLSAKAMAMHAARAPHAIGYGELIVFDHEA